MRRLLCLVLVLAGVVPFARAEQRAGSERLSRVMGPGTYGYFLALAVDPFDSDNVIAGSDMGIAYRSVDGGKTWRMIGESGVGRNPAHRGAMRVAFHPRRRGVVYFAGCHGLFRSSDGGQTWKLVLGGEPCYSMNALAFDPDEPETVYFAGGHGQHGKGWWKFPMGVYREGGAPEWLPPPPGMEDSSKGSYRRIVVDSGSVYLLGNRGCFAWSLADRRWRDVGSSLTEIRDIASSAKGVLLALKSGEEKSGGGLYRSDDGAVTWRRVSRGFGPSQTFSKNATLAISPSDPRVMYVAVSSAAYKSTDAGVTWERIDRSNVGWYTVVENGESFSFSSPTADTNFLPAEKNFWSLNTIAVTPDNPDVFYLIDGHGVLKSSDGGKTFSPLFLKYGKKVQTPPYPGIEQDTPNPWGFSKIDPNVQTVDPNQLAFDPFEPSRMALAIHDVGLHISDDYGRTWRRAHVGICGSDKAQITSVAFDPAVRGRIYAGPDRKHLPNLSWRYYVSDDCGFVWRPVEIPWLRERSQAKGRRNQTAVMKIYPRSDGLWLGTSDGLVIHSVDNRWRVVEDLKFLFIESVAFSSDGKMVLVSSRSAEKGGEAGLYRSTDGGATFVRLNKDGFGQVSSFCSSDDARTIFVAAQDRSGTGLFNSFRMYRSDDGGDTWVGPLQPDKRVHAVALDPSDPKRLLFATGAWNVAKEATGVWESEDLGVTARAIDPSQPIQLSPRVNKGFWFDPRRDDRFFISTSLGLYEYRVEKAVGPFGSSARAVESAVSPDGRNEIRLWASPLSYEVSRDGVVLVSKTPIGMKINGAELSQMAPLEVSCRALSGTVDAPVYKKSAISLSANETMVAFGTWAIRLVARNDGVAYRFETRLAGEIRVDAEQAGITIPEGGAECSFSYGNSFGCEETVPVSCRSRDIRMDAKRPYAYLPLVYGVSGKSVAVTESDVRDYPVWNLARADTDEEGVALRSVFAGWPKRMHRAGGWDIKKSVASGGRWICVDEHEDWLVKTAGTRTFPWRAFVLADAPSGFCQADIVHALASDGPSCDFSWVKPGKVAWDWWNSWNNKGESNGCNTVTYKGFVDFAAKSGIEYVILDEGWSETLNIWKFHPNVDVPEIIRYANERGVGIVLWMAWAQIYGDESRVACHFAKLGAKGFKVDFMDRGDAECERFLWKFAEECAKHRMIVDFHGVHHPAGMSRAYPNVLNYEGVHGLECAKWFKNDYDFVGCDVRHFFVRMTAGPMDYTPGAMDNYPIAAYSGTYDNPGSVGTRCHQMAMMVAYEAPLQMLCDAPSKYTKNGECFAFMAQTPVIWTDTVGLGGSPDTFAAVARRRNETCWYAAAINAKEAREFAFETSFLGEGTWRAESFCDASDSDRSPMRYRHQTGEIVKAGDRMSFQMAPGGGFVVKFTK